VKTLIAYYSGAGSTARVAGLLKTALNADIYEIKTLDPKKRRGPANFFWAISISMKKKKPALVPFTLDIKKYDLIILGTPVWAGGPSVILTAFLDQVKITGKKIALYCCHAGGPGETINRLKAQLAGNTIIGEIDFTKAGKANPDELKKKAEDWVKTLH